MPPKKQPSTTIAFPESLISEALFAGLALAETLKRVPFDEPANYELLRDAAVLATARAAKATPYWTGQAPDWAAHQGSALEGIAWLGRRLTCLVAAAAGMNWDAEDFLQAVTYNWPAVQEFVAKQFKPVPPGVLESSLRREARETAERPVNFVPLVRSSDGGWLDDQLTAWEELTASPAEQVGKRDGKKRGVEWRWVRDGFYRYDKKYPLTGQSLKLLKAFISAGPLGDGYVLTHQQINEACSDGTERAGAYVSELNKALQALWRLEIKPITAIHRQEAYRFTPPPVTDSVL